jgi:hypothetical protein
MSGRDISTISPSFRVWSIMSVRNPVLAVGASTLSHISNIRTQGTFLSFKLKERFQILPSNAIKYRNTFATKKRSHHEIFAKLGVIKGSRRRQKQQLNISPSKALETGSPASYLETCIPRWDKEHTVGSMEGGDVSASPPTVLNVEEHYCSRHTRSEEALLTPRIAA